MKQYTVRLCWRNAETSQLLITQEFPDKKFRSIKSGVKFLEGRVAGMKCIRMEPCIDIYGQVLDGESVAEGIALF